MERKEGTQTFRVITRDKCSHRIGPQGDAAPAAGAELGLAVGAQVAAAVGELGLVADAAGGRVVPVDGGARRHRRLPDHRLPVAGQLLLDSSAGQKKCQSVNKAAI